ncbi:MAG: FAD-dependent oxidoreductase [Acidimicrobiales bacterium]
MSARGGVPDKPAAGYDVVVIGGGAIGLACAWKAAAKGLSVALVEPEPGRGSSWAAAGMLAPVTEAYFGEEALLALNLASARRWPSFAEEVEADSGASVGMRTCGALVVAGDDGDRAWAQNLYAFQHDLGLDVEWLTGSRARKLEPNLAPGIRGALWAPGDHQVHTRRFIEALMKAALARGVTTYDQSADSILTDGSRSDLMAYTTRTKDSTGRLAELDIQEAGRVRGVSLTGGVTLATDRVVLAAGTWSAAIGGLPAGAVPPVRPIKGQILRLKGDPARPLMSRTVRGMVRGSFVYLVPREDGTVVLGATSEDKGFDTTVTTGAVYQLLRDSQRLMPATSELELIEARSGLRPASPDNAPLVGPSHLAGLVLATGHYRHGILLTPLTADAISAYLTEGEVPGEVAPFTPLRFEPDANRHVDPTLPGAGTSLPGAGTSLPGAGTSLPGAGTSLPGAGRP